MIFHNFKFDLIKLLFNNYIIIITIIISCFVDLPAGFDSDDEYVSDEDEKDNDIFEKSNNILPPTRKFQGIHPPPSSRGISSTSFAKDSSKSSVPTAIQWTRNTCARRAPGTDPLRLCKEFVSANSGKESDTKTPTGVASREQCTNKNGLDDSAPFGVPRRHRAKVPADTANWAWVEQVLKLKSQESRAPRGSQEV